MATSTHGAAPAALGYAAQLEHGLLELLGLAFGEPASMSLEVFDDIETLRGTERSFTQIKNKPGTSRDLTDMSGDVWSTLDGWREAWLTLAARETPRFALVTTQTAAPASALAALRPRPHPRSPEAAVDALERAAAESRSTDTAAARAEFLRLSGEERLALLRCVEVYDGIADASQVESRLLAVDKLQAAVDPTRVPALVRHIRGWWACRSLQHLHLVSQGHGDRITTAELEEQIHDGRRQLGHEALPVYDVLDDEDRRPESDDDTYLHQLRLIDAPPHREVYARESYRRAYAHRSLWGRLGLITEAELERYERDLIEEWALHRDELAITPCRNAADEKHRGMELLGRAELRVHRPFRAELQAPFVQRGSYHSLADRRQLGWHPRWAALLDEAGP